ncbi:malectin domain-containing carbohydrate-binding protein, partial [Larkinella arboricola]
PGIYRLQISARSAAHLLDRMVMFHSSVSAATAQAAAETKCTTGGTPTNQPPVVSTPIPDRTATVGEAFNYTFPTNTFSDPNADALTYRATLSSGAALPSWLTFNATNRTFSGVPTGTATLTVRVTANDGKGGQVSDDFSLRVNAPPSSPATTYRINAGGGSYTTSDGKAYSADNYASGGTAYSRSGDITNTTQDALYQTERYGNFTYNFPISNGTYTVILHFAEIYATGVNQRKFHVDIEGQRKLTEYDIVAKAGGTWKAVQESFSVSVSDGTLNVRFLNGSVNNAKVCAIEVVPAGSGIAIPYRTNAGGNSFTTSDGKAYSADNYASGGTAYSRSGDITNTTQDALYQTERYGNFSYNFPISNGTYTVVLHFAEIYATGVNQRKFHVDIEGQRKLTEYDITAKAGGTWKAVQESFSVSVSDGTLNVRFLNGSVNNAKVCAIEILPAGSTARLADSSAPASAEGGPVVRTYPNPTPGTVTIDGINTTCSDFRVTVVQGLSESEPQQVITSDSQVQLQLGNLPTGLYILRIRQCGNSLTEKVIVAP